MPGNLYDQTLEDVTSTPQITPAPPSPTPQSRPDISAPPPINNPLQELDNAQTLSLRHAQVQAHDTSPDRAAQVLDLSQKSGLPPEVVERNYDTLAKRAAIDAVPYQAIVEQSPHLAAWLQEDPQHTAVAKDDLEHLGNLEWITTAPQRAFAQSMAQMRLGHLESQSLYRDLTQEEKDQINAEEFASNKDGAMGAGDSWFRGAVLGAANLMANIGAGTVYSAPQIAIGAGVGGFLGLMAGSLAGPEAAIPGMIQGGQFGAKVGGLVGGAQFTFELEAGLALNEYKGVRDEHGQPLDPAAMRAAAIFAGAVNAGLEVGGLEIGLNTIPGLKKLGRKGVQNVVKDALRNPTVRAALGGMVKEYGETLASESLVEVAQRAYTIIGREVATITSGKPGSVPGQTTPGNIDLRAQPKVPNADGSISTVDSLSVNMDGREVLLPTVTPDGRHFTGDTAAQQAIEEFKKTGRHLGMFTTPKAADDFATGLHNDYAAGVYDKPKIPTGHQVLDDLVNEGIGAVQSFALGLAIGPGFNIIHEARQAKAAQQSVAFYDALAKGVTDSKLVQRMPQAAQDFLTRTLKDGPMKDVFIPASQFQEYWQSKKIDPAVMAAELTGRPDALARAIDTGEDLQVPTAAYAIKLAGTEHHAFFSQELRSSPDAMNGRESDELAARVEASMKADQERQASQEQAAKSPEEQVRDQVAERLVAAGTPAETARTQAATYEAMFGTLAKRAGVDPLEVYRQYGLTVERPGITDQAAQSAPTAAPAPAGAPQAMFVAYGPSGPLYNVVGGASDRSTVGLEKLAELGIAVPETPPDTGEKLSGDQIRERVLAAQAAALGGTTSPAATDVPFKAPGSEVPGSAPPPVGGTIGDNTPAVVAAAARFREAQAAGEIPSKFDPAAMAASHRATRDTKAPEGGPNADTAATPAGPGLSHADPQSLAAAQERSANGPGEGPGPDAGAAERIPPSARDHFDHLAANARELGYSGDYDSLAARYLERLDKANEIAADLEHIENDGGWRELLVEISKMGGISLDAEQGGGYAGEVAWLLESLQAKEGRITKGKRAGQYMPRLTAGLKGAPGVVKGKGQGGLALDRVRENLQQDPRWAHYDDIAVLYKDLEDAVLKGHIENQGGDVRAAGGGVANAIGILEGLLDVRPGVAWWAEGIADLMDGAQLSDAEVNGQADSASSFDPRDFAQTLLDDLEGPDPTADVLTTGEVQPRLPGAEDVRTTENATPQLEAPFSLTSEVSKGTDAKQTELFQNLPPNFDLVSPHLSDQERNKQKINTATKLVTLFKALPHDAEFASAALRGIAKRGWYRESARALSQVFGADTRRFVSLLAAMSPQTSVEANLLNATTMWANWIEAGRPTSREKIVSLMAASVQGSGTEDSVLDAWINNTERALASRDVGMLSGPKVDSFQRNLTGDLFEVTNDAWMANFANISQKLFKGKLNLTDPGKTPGYIAMSAKVRRVAKALSVSTGEAWTPAEVQETVWSWTKTLYELSTSTGTTAEEIVRTGGLSDEAILSTPDFSVLLPTDPTVRQILDAAGYKEALNAVEEEFSSRAGRDRRAADADRGRAAVERARAGSQDQAVTLSELRAARRLDKLRVRREAQKARTAAKDAADKAAGRPVKKRTEYDQSAYHGSPHTFDKFSLQAIGSGEGAQAYGYGLYFASKREVAEGYRDRLSSRDHSPEIRLARSYIEKAGSEAAALDLMHHQIQAYDAAIELTGKVEAAVDAEPFDVAALDAVVRARDAAHYAAGEQSSGLSKSQLRAGQTYLRNAMEAIENGDLGAAGRVYTVEIPEDGDYLDWDKPASAQGPKVQAALKAIGLSWDHAVYPPLDEAVERIEKAMKEPAMRYSSSIADDLREGHHLATGGYQEAFERWFDEHRALLGEKASDPKGGDLYSRVGAKVMRDAKLARRPGELAHASQQRGASELLAQHGVAGIRYLDGFSRNTGAGSSNYVVFDDKLVEVKEFNQSALEPLTDADVREWAADTKEGMAGHIKQFDVTLTRGGDLELLMMAIDRGSQRAGMGTALMQELTGYADQHGKRIILSPATKDEHHGTTSRARLVKFYKRFGFLENKGRRRDFAISAGMYREPTFSFDKPMQPAAPELTVDSLERIATDEAMGVQFPENQPSHFPDGSEAVVCTNCAEQIIKAVGRGDVWGWEEGTNPTSVVAGPESGAHTDTGQGHDFAIIDRRFLVDAWAKNVEGSSPRAAFDLADPGDRAEVLRLYGDPTTWLRRTDQGFIHDKLEAFAYALPKADAKQDTVTPPAGDYATRTALVTTSVRSLGVDRVTNQATAARALSYLARGAQERMDGLVTDAAGKPLAIVGSFKGNINQTTFFPDVMLAEAIQVQGAAKIWIAHNHPSGSHLFSTADGQAWKVLQNRFKDTGISTEGFLAIGAPDSDGGRAFSALLVDENEKDFNKDYIDKGYLPKFVGESDRGAKVPHVEREFTATGKLGAQILNAQDAINETKRLLEGKFGVLFLDTKHRAIAAVPFNADEAHMLRKDGRLAAVVRAVSASAPASAIVSSGSDVAYLPEATNLANALAHHDVEVVDIIDTFSDGAHSRTAAGTMRITKEFSQQQEGRRGSIRFGDDKQFTISLFEKADLSTFLHESGHFFLEVMGDFADKVRTIPETSRTDGQRGILRDYETVLKHLGVQTRDQLGTPHHEEFARTFEAYLMTGEAPSLSLREAFGKFRAWLLGVYKEIRNLNINLTPEVTAVMDRLLATDRAIEEAKAVGRVDPMFLTAEAAGMTDAQFGLYQKNIEAASRVAREKLDAQVLGEVLRERKAVWRERHAEVKAEVSTEVEGRPVYRALAAILRGTHPNGEALEDVSGPLKLSRAILSERFGQDRLARLPKGLTIRDGGLDPNPIADLFGYSSADEMLTALEQAPPMRGVIDAAVNQRMVQEFGSMLLDGSLPDRAKAALSSDERETVIRAELRALGQLRRTVDPFVKQAKQEGKDALRQERKERDYERRWFEAEKKLEVAIAQGRKQVEIDELKQEIQSLKAKARGGPAVIRAAVPPAGIFRASAITRIAGTRMRDLQPQVFWSASRRAAALAVEAAARQDFDAAITAKQQELMNLALYRAAENAKTDAEARVRKAKLYAKPAARARLGQAGRAYLEQVDAILDRYEFAPVSRKDLDRRSSLRKFVEGLEAQGIPVDLPDELLEEARRVNHQELTYEELVGVTDGLDQIAHLAQLKNRLLKNQQHRDLAEAAGKLVDSIQEHSRSGQALAGTVAGDRHPKEETRRSIADFFGSHRKLASMLREMDGFKDGGALWDAVLRPLNEAATSEAEMTSQATIQLSKLFDEAFPGREKSTLYDKAFIPQINTSLSRMQRIMVAMNWGNEGNRERVRSAYKWQDGQVRAILDTLTAADLKFVQGTLDHINSYWPEIAAKQERVYGIAPDKVDATPIEAANGTIPGGYFPLKYDDRLSAGAIAHLDLEAANLSKQAAYAQATTKRGHTKARAERVSMPVRLDFGVIFGHHTQVIHDLTHHETLIDVARLLGHRDVQAAIIAAQGDQVFKSIKNTIRDVAFGDVPAVNGVERGLNHLRTGATIAGLGWNLTTALLQPIGLSNSVARIGAKWVGKGVWRWVRSPTMMIETVRWIEERSDFMRHRGMTMQREISEIRNQLGVNTGKLSGWIDSAISATTFNAVTRQGIADSYFAVIQQGQRLADVPTWLGQYEKSMAGGETEDRAAALADQAVLDSQGGGQTKDLSQVQRGGPMMKLWTNFYSYFNVVYNQAAEAGRRTNLRHPAEVGRLASDYLMLFIVPSVLGYAVRQAMKAGGDDDDKDLEDHFKAIVGDVLSSVAGTMVGVRELSSAMGGYMGYQGPAGARAFSELGKLGKQVQQGEIDEALIKSLNATFAVLFHYPGVQMQRTVSGIAALAEGRTINPAVLLTGAPKAAK